MIEPTFPAKIVGVDPSDWDDLVEIGRSDGADVVVHSGGKAVRPPATRSRTGKLAPVCRSTIDWDALTGLEARMGRLRDLLNRKETFVEEVFRVPLEDIVRYSKMSRHTESYLDYSIEVGILQETHKAGLIEAPLFTIAKKSGDLRLVWNGVPFNLWCNKPPGMNIPSIHGMIDYVMECEWAAVSDAFSFFYQISLGSEVQEFFTVKAARQRGEYYRYVFTRLPMGWTWAPYIGQEIANAVVGPNGKVWVDNFVIGGRTAREFEEHRIDFLRRARAVNLKLDDEVMSPMKTIDLLGFQADLELKRYRMAPKWAEKTSLAITAVLTEPQISYQQL